MALVERKALLFSFKRTTVGQCLGALILLEEPLCIAARSGLTLRERGYTPMKVQAPPPGYRWVFRPWITLRDGTRLYASRYGKKAFKLLVLID